MYCLLFMRTRPVSYTHLPEAGRQAKGTAIVNLLRLQAGEKITAAFPVEHEQQGKYLVMATRGGSIKKTALSEYENIRQNGLIAMGVREEDELTSVFMTSGEDQIIVGTRKGMSIRFHEKDIRPMGRTAYGVRSTVSYTHLDVYKRQRLQGRTGMIFCWRLQARTHAAMLPRDSSERRRCRSSWRARNRCKRRWDRRRC